MSHSEVHFAKPSGWFLVWMLILLVGAAFAVKLLLGVNANQPPEDAARIEERLKARDELAAANETRLNTYGWTDQAAGAVQIPITVAMELTLADLKNRQPEPAGPIVPPAETAPAAAEETPATAPASSEANTAPASENPAAAIPSSPQ